MDPSFDPCDTRRLYLHAICRVRAVDKEAFLAYHKALFVKVACRTREALLMPYRVGLGQASGLNTI